MNELAGFVTAGGRSSRMGRDKAFLPIAGRPMIDHVIEAVKGVASPVALIANDDRYCRFGLPVIADTTPGIGPIEAIRTAMINSPARRFVLLACDLPFVTPALLSLLAGKIESNEAVVPQDQDGRLAPLCAIYSKDSIASVNQLIAAGELKLSTLLGRIQTRIVRFGEISHLYGARLFFVNVNTPREYDRALRMTRLDSP